MSQTRVRGKGPGKGAAPGARLAPVSPGSSTFELSLPLAGVALAVVCLVAYWNSFRAELLLDNRGIILQDPRLRAVTWQNISDIFSRSYWWPTSESDLFRPVTTLTYLLDYTLGGESPFGYHAVNLVLHYFNALLAFVLVRAITKRPGIALVTAGVVACHPLTVESVTNVVGRADLLSGLSLLGGLYLFRRWMESGKREGWPWLAALAATYAVGVFCKESAVVLPGLMLLYVVMYPADREAAASSEGGIHRVLRYAPAFLATLPGLVLLLYARWALFHDSPLYGQNGLDNPLAMATTPVRLMTAVKVIGYYLALSAWPARLSCDYSYNQITLFGGTLTGQDLHAWLALVGLLALAVFSIAGRHRHRHAVFFLGFSAITLLPSSNLLFPIGTAMAERLMYTPLVGLTAAATLLLAEVVAVLQRSPAVPPRRRALLAAVPALVIVAALCARTLMRNEDWTSAIALWTSAADASPNSYKVHQALATSITEADPGSERIDEVIALSTRALRIVEDAPVPVYQRPTELYAKTGWYYLRKAEALARAGARDAEGKIVGQAIDVLRRGEEVDRALNKQARERLTAQWGSSRRIHDIGNETVYRNLASAYVAAGDLAGATSAAEYMQHLAPQDYDAHYTRGVVEAAWAQKEKAGGNEAVAEQHLESAAVNFVVALLLKPDHDAGWQTLARIYFYLAPPAPAPIQPGGSRPSFNLENPVVARDVARAATQLVRQLRESGQDEAADTWRDQLSSEFHLRREMVDGTAGK